MAACLAAGFLAIEPRTVDFAAHTFRAGLFEREGFTLWNGAWYGGHHTPGYSVLFPPLAALVGAALVGALACVAAAAAFEALVHERYGERARWGALWFGAATVTMLFTGRLPFALGVALGLLALVALQRRRPAAAALLAAACALASPVAGAFLALGALAYGLAARHPPAGGVAVAALAPPIALALAFPEGGHHPFSAGAFVPVPLFAAGALVLLPRTERTLRVAAGLYGLACLAAFLVDSPMGANSTRLGALFGGPLLACAALPSGAKRRMAVLLAAALAALAVWQWLPAVRDLRNAASDPTAVASFYAPLLGFLERTREPPARIEVVFTKSHWEAVEVATRMPIARGWQRQLDTDRNALFYEGRLDPRRYRRWLRDQGIRFVALPRASLDYSAEQEARLVAAEPPYLARRFASRDWLVYEVRERLPLLSPESGARLRLLRLGFDSLELEARSPGSALARVRWTPYWHLEGGCVERSGDWTRVTARRTGRLRMTIAFSPERLLSHGRRCD